MSITSEINRTAELITDGAETEFDFALLIHDDSEVQVWYEVTGGSYTQLVLDTDYNVVFTELGGTVTTIGVPLAAGKLLIIRNILLTQQTNWLYMDNHSEQQHQDDFDRSVMRDLQIQEQLDRAVKFDITSSTTDIAFPEPEANTFIGWNAVGTALENKDDVTGLVSLPVTDGNFIVGDGTTWVAESGATARASLGLTIGTDVLAWQAIGIDDDNLLEVDGVANSGEYARFTANGLEGRTLVEMAGEIDHDNLDGVALVGDSTVHDVRYYTETEIGSNDTSTSGATLVGMAIMPTATYSTLRDDFTLFRSAGQFTDGAISDAGGATINVAAGTGAIRPSDDHTAELCFADWDASNGIAIPTDTVRYIGVEYDVGPPVVAQVVVKSSDSWNLHNEFPLGSVVNESDTLHITNRPHFVANAIGHTLDRFHETEPIVRAEFQGGLILGESADGNFNVTLTAGALWDRLTKFPVAAINTAVSGTFDAYVNGALDTAGRTTWDNQNYNNGGAKAALGVNKWGVLWFYLELDGDLVMEYGTSNTATQAQAENETAPTTVSPRITDHGILIGRMIFRKGNATATVETVFETTFAATGVTDHGGLAGLTDDDHTQYILANGTRALAGAWNMANRALTNVNIDSGTITGITDLAIADGGTGASTAAAARANIGNSAPAAKAYRATTQTIATSTTTVLQCDTEVFDLSGDFDSTTNYRFTPSEAGKYCVTAHAEMASVSSGKFLRVSIYKNGTEIALTTMYGTGGSFLAPSITTTVVMNGSTDYLDARVRHDNGANRNVTGGERANSISAFLILPR